LGLELLLFFTHYNLHLPKDKSPIVDGVVVDFLYSFLGFDWGGLFPNDFGN
jgi:hypothetical protein